MSPFPGEGIDADPNSAIQARNAQMLSEMGAGGHAPTPGATGWPGGMGPQPLEDMSMGLPSHLTQPGSAFVPSPEDRDPNGSFSTLADPNSVPTTPDDETRRMMLSPSDDKVTKLKCPKCGHVQAASNKKCAECGHDLEKARGGKFAKLDASADDLELGKKPDFLKKDEDDDKNKGDDAKSKCPKCKAENPSAAKKCRRCKHNLVGVKGGNFSIPDGHRAKIYQLSLAQDDLREGVEQDGLIWKIACKSGVLALSPGPGNVAVDKPLHLTGELFRDMVLSLQEKAFPYTTVPETHNNGSLENTGYVRDAVVLTKQQALLDQRIKPKAREAIAADPDDTEYLLAGIEFTNPTAKAKALEGSIPDTSIGVKFGWRNTRTGKTFKAAWEHLALTPMPWVDGLPAFGMSANGFKAPTKLDREQYDGVFVDMPLDLAIRFDPKKHPRDFKGRFMETLDKLGDGEEALLPGNVRVRKSTEHGNGVGISEHRYVVEKDGEEIADTYHIENAVESATETSIHADPAVDFDDDGNIRSSKLKDALDKSITDVDTRHPRDKIREMSDAELHSEVIAATETANAPDGPALRAEWRRRQAKTSVGKHFTADSEGAAVADWLNVMQTGDEFTIEDADDHTNVWVVSKQGFQQYEVDDGSGRPFSAGSDRELMEIIGFDPDLAAEILDDEAKDHNLRPKRGRPPFLAQDGAAASSEGLTLSGLSGEVDAELHASHRQENSQMPRTVEELLASQQVDLEQAQQRVAALEQSLQLAQGTITSQGEQLHMDAVRKRIEGLEGTVSPSMALAAKTIMEADKSRITGEGGLNLSITAATTDDKGEIVTAKKTLKSATDIVEYMLSAAATEDGDIATRIAGVQQNIGTLQLSAHEDRSAEDEAKAAVEANERQRHPERFKDNGKGDRIV